MNPVGIGLLCVATAVMFETVGQVTMKKGTQDMPVGIKATALRILTNYWIQLALAAFFLESVFWTWTLHLLPLSVAFPMGSSCFATVAIFSAVLLKERISLERWAGIALILVGVVLIGMYR
ncbi:MAG TPA: EamA family transporter [Phycisphaerae bacterium]|nr:EamA family transporter [Phycisphaerae bacterium]